MKRRIILLRHAKTEPYEYNKNDFKRNLTERGIADCHLITAALKAKDYQIQHIVSSPANRTQQTAVLFAEDFALSPNDIQYQQSIYDGITTQEMLNLFLKVDSQKETVLFVGHNPDISRFAYRLTRSFEHYVPTCCAIVLETQVAQWQQLGSQPFDFKDIFTPKNYK